MYVQKIGRVATSKPVLTLGEAKAHCDVCHDEDDTRLLALVEAATEYVENAIDGAIRPTSYVMYLRQWVECLDVPRQPLKSVTSVKYWPQDGGPMGTWTGYDVIVRQFTPGQLLRKPTESFPSLADHNYPIEIAYVAGYDTTPEPLKHAVKLLVRHWYDEPSPMIAGSSSAIERSLDSLIRMYKPGNVAGVDVYG